MAKVKYVDKINDTKIFAERASHTQAGVEIDSALQSIATELENKPNIDEEETGNGTYIAATQRLVFENIIFDNIYPQVGKYGLAIFSETTNPDAISFAGDREWLLDWRPYLIDMNPVEGETAKKPIAELKKNNWLRKIDGSYAMACGIKSTQATALDGKSSTLYWKSGSTGDLVSTTVPNAFDSSGNFVPSALWEYLKANMSAVNTLAEVTYNYPIEVKLYIGSQSYEYGAYTDYHIPAPWETTRTDLSVFIGRAEDVYLVDGQSDTTGEFMRGLTAKPLPVGSKKFDPDQFKLARTGISPGPSTVISSKIRNFFYNYVNSNSSYAFIQGSAGNTSIFYQNGTYPATDGPNQYRCANWSRACNSGGSSGNAVPVGEQGYHSINAFLCSIESAFGSRNLWASDRFSSGVSSNFSASYNNGGCKIDTTWVKWGENTSLITGSTKNCSEAVNNYYSKFQCMEPQIAASIAAEMEVAEGSEFHWNGGTWRYVVPSFTDMNGPLDGEMNSRIYKVTDAKIVNGHSIECHLVCALTEGVNLVGDIWWYIGGGAECVFMTTGNESRDYNVSFYLEPNQTKWMNTNTDENHINGSKFFFEDTYPAILTDSTVGGNSDTYLLARTGYSPVRRIPGGSNTTGECCYQYRSIDDNAKGSSGIRSRRRLLFRGASDSTNCSPRYFAASSRPSTTNRNAGCAAQLLLA